MVHESGAKIIEILIVVTERSGSIQTFDSLDWARYSDDGDRQVEDRVAGLCSEKLNFQLIFLQNFNPLSYGCEIFD